MENIELVPTNSDIRSPDLHAYHVKSPGKAYDID